MKEMKEMKEKKTKMSFIQSRTKQQTTTAETEMITNSNNKHTNKQQKQQNHGPAEKTTSNIYLFTFQCTHNDMLKNINKIFFVMQQHATTALFLFYFHI